MIKDIDKNIWRGYSFKEKLYVISERFHFLSIMKFINRKIFHDASYQKDPNSWESFCLEWEQSIECFKNIIPSNNKKIVFSGHILEFDKGTCAYLNQINKEIFPDELILLSHAVNVKKTKADSLIDFNYYSVPYTLSLNRYQKNVDIYIPDEIIEFIDSKEYLVEQCIKIESRHKDMGENYAKAIIFWLYRYYIEFLDHFKPEIVILWCEFYAGHSFLKNICEEKGINILYMEFGALPGTFALEQNGQMGESLVSIDYEKFRNKYVNDFEIENAKSVLSYLKESKLNRRTQVKTDILKKFKENYIPNRPIIVYFGQNDYEAGIKPYTERSKEFHSPFFASSDDAAVYIERLCKKNKWNFIYKPHQMMVRVGECLEHQFSDKTTWVGDSDINELIDIADVCITIVSQCAYISLIREKPIMTLGYTQLRGKGCAYEIESKTQIESTINKIIAEGYTDKQKKNFQIHVAQMLKYYLFDDMQKEVEFGQPIEKAVGLIKDILKDGDVFYSNSESHNKKVLFVCANSFQIEIVKIIKDGFTDNTICNLVIINKTYPYKELENYFETVVKVDDILDADSEILYDEVYDDLFVYDYNIEIVNLYNELKVRNSSLKVHIFDNGGYVQYIKDISTDFKIASKDEESRDFFDSVCEMLLCERKFKIWKDKIEFPITNVPYCYENEMTSDGKDIFVFCEGDFYSKKNVSNELELFNLINKYLDDVIVIRNNESDINIYKGYGYRTCECLEDIFVENMVKKIYIFSATFNDVYLSLKNNKNVVFFDLSKLIITNNKFMRSNSYCLFLANIEKMELNNYYIPYDISEIKTILKYKGVNVFDVDGV